MKDNMEEIDSLIKETLTEEESKFYDGLEEQGVFEMVKGLFNGKNKWIMLLMNFMTVVFFILFIYCIVQFFNADVTKEIIKWASGTILFLMGMSMLKLFAWMQMDKNAIIRELKRLEIQLSSLSGKISNE